MSSSLIEILMELIDNVLHTIAIIAILISYTLWFPDILKHKLTLKNRIILIIFFGLLSIFGTYSGLEVSGAIANTRDLGPMVAGLMAGPIVGLGAGLIGGIHRYFIGGFTNISCALATILSGLFAGIIYSYNKGRFIGLWKAVLFAALMESFHMVLTIFIARPISQAIILVREVSLPVILANSLGMAIFAFIIQYKLRQLKISHS